MNWSPTQYTRFETERNQPISDLLARISGHPVKTAVDIGCGPGNSTQLLKQAFPQANITGFDSSPDMIEAARERLPETQFEVSNIATWEPQEKVDLIFGNAVLQWLPDHATLLPRLLGYVNTGGLLAIQIPDNLDQPTHQLMPKIGEKLGLSSKLEAAANSREPRHTPDWYFQVLSAHASRVDVWRTIYFHNLPGGIPGIVEWFKGTGLRPYLSALTDKEQMVFLKEYEAGLAKSYPLLPDGSVLLPFPRLFFTATR